MLPSLLLVAALLVPGESARALNDRGLALLSKGEFDEAISALKRAVEASGDDPVVVRNLSEARNRRGIDHLEHDRLRKAIVDFDASIRLCPELPHPWVHLAYTYLRYRDLVRAQAVLDGAKDWHADEPRLLDVQGALSYRQDDLPRAIRAFERRLKLAPDAAAKESLVRARREHEVSGEFVDRSSRDFTVRFLGTRENLRVVDDYLEILQEARDEICRDLGREPRGRTIVLIYSPTEFQRVTGAHDWVGGQYDGRIRLPIEDLARQRRLVPPLARHEFTHRLLDDLAPTAPSWLHEGLAEWYGRRGEACHDEIRAVARKIRIPRLREVPASFGAVPDPGTVRVLYALSRSFVAFLREEYGVAPLKELIEQFGAGRDADAAVRRAYGRGLDDVEAIWYRSVIVR